MKILHSPHWPVQMEDWLNVRPADREAFHYLWLIWMASTWTLRRRGSWTSKNVAGGSSWGVISLRLRRRLRLAEYSTRLPTCVKRQKYTHYAQVLRPNCDFSLHVRLIIWSCTLPRPGGLERLGTLSDCSGVPKMLEAILWGFLDAAASSSYPPNRLLEPPPGGRRTLHEDTELSQNFVYCPRSNCCDGMLVNDVSLCGNLFRSLWLQKPKVTCVITQKTTTLRHYGRTTDRLVYCTRIGVKTQHVFLYKLSSLQKSQRTNLNFEFLLATTQKNHL